MRHDWLERIRTWSLRLFWVSVLLALALAAWGIQRGSLTAVSVGRALSQVMGVKVLPEWEVALIAGHRGFDTGALCEDGLMEVAITEAVAELTAVKLRDQRVAVRILDEYDPVLEGLQVDALVSIHVDSCIDLSGFKVSGASETIIPDQDARLVRCLQQNYAATTQMPVHLTTITADMTGYHAFQRVDATTPGAIIELGFLGGDRDTLTNRQDVMAQGIANGVFCFLDAAERSGSQ